MLRLWNNLFHLLVFFSFLLICSLNFSCGFIDLRPIGISIEPNKMNSILPEQYSPVIIKFDTEVIKHDTEGIVQINSDLGAIKGDISWHENDLYFTPIQGWTAGIRYTLSVMGTIRAADGREIRVNHFIPFYAINRNIHPTLENYTPSSGESTGTRENKLEFYFSHSMDKNSVESALTLDGINNKTFEWSLDDRILTVTPNNNLNPWTVYKWSLRDSAKNISGVPLPKAYSGFFTTDLDKTLPFVTNIFPVLYSDGCWYPTGGNIETDLGHGNGIAVSFNKSMGESVLRSLRFEPSLSGKTEYLSDNSIVYIPTRNPEPGIIYTLIVSGETKDKEGIKIGFDHITYFTADIPVLNVLSFTADHVYSFENSSETNVVIPVSIAPGTGELFFSIRFSLSFNLEEKLAAPQRISLASFFPRTTAPIALQYVSWISDDRLYMRWEGLSSPNDEYETYYYKLIIPGGRSGISSETGIYMEKDLIFYLTTSGGL